MNGRIGVVGGIGGSLDSDLATLAGGLGRQMVPKMMSNRCQALPSVSDRMISDALAHQRQMLDTVNEAHVALAMSRPCVGFPVKFVADDLIPPKRVQFRVPRSKKKRIRDKWGKDARNWRDADGVTCMRCGDTFYVPNRLKESFLEQLKSGKVVVGNG